MTNARQHQQHSLTKRLTIGLVFLGLFFPVAVFGNESAASGPATPPVLAPWCAGHADLTINGCSLNLSDTQFGLTTAISFGCEGSTGAMVISNVDCAMGVANAFDIDQSDGLAPWCNDPVDLTVYGCSIEQPDTEPQLCHRDVPTLHPDGVQRAAQNPCDGDEWVDGVLARLAANEIVTSRCLALAAPGPSCIP